MEDLAIDDLVRAFAGGFVDLLGIRFEEASADRVVGTLEITERLHQDGGVARGGVYASVAETVASLGAHLWLAGQGRPIGISNQLDCLRSVSAGTVRAVAIPLDRQKELQVWQVALTDDQDRLVAHAHVTLVNQRGVRTRD